MSVCRIAMLGLSLALGGCSLFSGSDSSKTANDYKEVPVEQLYNKAMDDLALKEWGEATTDFDEVDRQHPTSVWATKAQLMGAYARYQNNKLDDAVSQLDRYIQLHPGNKDVAYAYYLKAVCYYEQIEDVERDQSAAEHAVDALQAVIDRFPNSIYARDSRFKLVTVRDHLAGREMEIGRFYEAQREFSSAVSRYRMVLDQYQTTTQVPEALYRLVECYEALGLTGEAAHDAAVLGYNYPGSSWYASAYSLLKKLSPDVVASLSPGSSAPAATAISASVPVPASVPESNSTAIPPPAPPAEAIIAVVPPSVGAPASGDISKDFDASSSAVPSIAKSAAPPPPAAPGETPATAQSAAQTADTPAASDPAKNPAAEEPAQESGLLAWLHKFW